MPFVKVHVSIHLAQNFVLWFLFIALGLPSSEKRRWGIGKKIKDINICSHLDLDLPLDNDECTIFFRFTQLEIEILQKTDNTSLVYMFGRRCYYVSSWPTS